MAAHSQDDAFREIQLNGKQLVFLFMAATVVSVVIFLCGVLVGRGVRAERAAGGEVAVSSPGVEAPPPAQAPVVALPPPEADPTKAAPPTPPAEPSVTDQQPKPNTPNETVKAAAGKSGALDALPKEVVPKEKEKEKREATPEKVIAKAVEKPVAPPPAPAKPPAPTKEALVPAKEALPAAVPGAEPQGSGYVVQVAALNVRSEADAIAKRLTSKGYDAYVVSSTSGTPQVFRVRIGKFGSRHEAETLAAKLQKEEQFKPWVTR